MNLKEALSNLPETDKNVVAVLSGGLDSSVMTMMLVEKYGAERVSAISYDYGQKQKVELEKAAELTKKLGVGHKILDLSILGDIAKPICANIGGTDVEMPDIEDVLGDPQPPTYVPFRNMILLSLTMSAAEVASASHIFTGLQVHDEYGYWDTSQKFVDSMNSVASQNRTHNVSIVAPFSLLSKAQEIEICREMDKVELLGSTLTCYNPNDKGESCGKCPSCAERVMNFMKVGIVDPIPYSIDIPWK
jgi:7-cyano-7-deazaguanine synthase